MYMKVLEPSSLTGLKVDTLSASFVFMMCVRKALARFLLQKSIYSLIWLTIKAIVYAKKTLKINITMLEQTGGWQPPQKPGSLKFWEKWMCNINDTLVLAYSISSR